MGASKLPKGIRAKLIGIFILIKVIPLVLIAWFAWHSSRDLGEEVSTKVSHMADAMISTIKTVGQSVTDDSIRALELPTFSMSATTISVLLPALSHQK